LGPFLTTRSGLVVRSLTVDKLRLVQVKS